VNREGCLQGKKVAVLVGEEFEDAEALYPILRLREEGAEVVVASEDGEKALHGKHGYPLEPDASFDELKVDAFDAIVIPGGYGPDHVRTSQAALDLVKGAFAADKVVAAVCHGPWVLASAGVAKGKELTSWPSVKDDLVNAGARWKDAEVVVDGRLITSRKPDDLGAFMRATIACLAGEAQEERAAQPAEAGRRRTATARR
jgi:protease I